MNATAVKENVTNKNHVKYIAIALAAVLAVTIGVFVYTDNQNRTAIAASIEAREQLERDILERDSTIEALNKKIDELTKMQDDLLKKLSTGEEKIADLETINSEHEKTIDSLVEEKESKQNAAVSNPISSQSGGNGGKVTSSVPSNSNNNNVASSTTSKNAASSASSATSKNNSSSASSSLPSGWKQGGLGKPSTDYNSSIDFTPKDNGGYK